jgi:hypothetical protein
VSTATRKRILVVNAFFDEYWRTTGSPYRIPQAMGAVYLAGAFAPARCEVRIYNEQYSGPLRDPALLGWPDMLVLTGVTSSFDRMLQLTAYARTLNPAVIVVAGGAPVRALPRRARRFFDYVCLGDIEQLQEIARAALGDGHAADEMFPRYDLMPPGRLVAYVESSRYCNFRCSFCSLTAEQAKYQTYDLDYVRRQIAAVGNKQVVFIDNNFYGNDRDFFLARVALLRELYERRMIRGWSALVTGDFFRRSENLELARRAGCTTLFSGVESFDAATLAAFNKRQNMLVPQVEMIRGCLEAGIYFAYGIMLDPSTRPLADLRREIAFIVGRHDISLPAFFTLAIPLLGTPYFRDCMARRLFFPDTRLRDLDGVTLTMRPLDPLPEAIEFVQGLPNLRGHRAAVWRHVPAFLARYGRRLNRTQLTSEIVTAALISTRTFATSPGGRARRGVRPTYYGPTQPLDPLYTPLIPLPERFRDHFRPTMVTDAAGEMHADIAADLAPGPHSHDHS